METPSSTTRRVTRSQTLSAASNSNINNNNIPMSRKIEDSEKGVSKSRPRIGNPNDRSALIDITNDSPIVGLAMGTLETPLSTMSKKRINNHSKQMMTPGSGEALLRGQVKTLLQNVEEEAEISKISLEKTRFVHFQGFVNSPMGLLAPTPANTPQILNLFDAESLKNCCLAAVTPSPVQEQLMISQMVAEVFEGAKLEEGPESEKNLITRSLLFDFSEKSDSSDCSSVLTNEVGSGGDNQGEKKSALEDDDSSVWSIQVNTSTRDEEEEEEEEFKDYVEENEDGEYEEDDDGGLVDNLCEGLSKISVNGEMKMSKFSGKHTRFVYNSDDELQGEEKCGGGSEASPGIVRLKGFPTPKGKHLRFPEDLEEQEDY